MNKPPTIKQINSLCQSRLFTIESLDLAFANGQSAVFERIRANISQAAVMVAAVNADNEILLVREWAAGSERYELQLPKGIVEADETSEQAANRELAEETGYAARELKFLQTLRTSPGYFQHDTNLILATDLYENPLDSGDEPEPPQLVKFPLAEIDALLQRDDFSESRSIAGLLLVLRELNQSG